MADSNTEVANLAIGHLGVLKEIEELDTDRSAEGLAVRRFWTTALRQTLRDFDWSFATKFADLTLQEEEPSEEWGYSYRYPTDCVKFRRIRSGSRNDSRRARIKYRIAKDDEGKLIYTDLADAACEYTEYVSNVAFWPDDFVQAFSLKLAFYIIPTISAGDPSKLKMQIGQWYQLELRQAQANDLNEQATDVEPESEAILARGEGTWDE